MSTRKLPLGPHGLRVKVDHNGCWIYGSDPHQYATFEGRQVHRIVYEAVVAKIPDGHHVHHKCEVRACCNPDHLIAVSAKEHGHIHAAHALGSHYSQGPIPNDVQARMDNVISPAAKQERAIGDAVEMLRKHRPDLLA